ncbi:MAG TPA: laccase domain-containing protein [Thermodesulfatator sp.]|nr:laccase domain-containing protein [Thermodesulfatator sp.]
MFSLVLEKRGPLLLYRAHLAPDLEILVSTRFGGASKGPYEGLNLSYSVGDDPCRVRENLSLLKEVAGVSAIQGLRQVHGNRVVCVESAGLKEPEADGLITTSPGLGLLIRQADCQAVVLYDEKVPVLANLHCGWRGLRAGLIARTLSLMKRRFGACPRRLLAFIAPSLGPCCGEFRERKRLPESFWRHSPRPLYVDLWAVAREQLLRQGLPMENIFVSGLCTVCHPEFYSFRRQGLTGRFGTLAFMR